MILRKEVQKIAEDYDQAKIHISTIASHSALNIFKGAKDENISTLCLCERNRKAVYDHFPIIDE